MFSWVLIIVLKNNVILMKDGGGGGGGSICRKFPQPLFINLFTRSFIIILKFHPQLTRKTRLTLLKNNGMYDQGLCGSLWITKNLGHIVV